MNIRSQTCPKKSFAQTNHQFLLPSRLRIPSLAIPEEGHYLSRNIPHPKRVYHIKGLNDVPICYVKDERYFPIRLEHQIARLVYPDKEYLFQHASSGKSTITSHWDYLHEAKGFPPQTEHWKLWKQGLGRYIEKTRLPMFTKTIKKKEDPSKRTVEPSLKPAFQKNPPDGNTRLDYE
ncbi:uncharacterized protein C4orf17 homolog [Microcaecilia unicolor]|uniref:Uncharacterized protein C4orf17 homolog n=1 Tax=Microcaecilia unicolor TaxID=1415580 RepID=A0A6P7X2A2_9AMPH|nr:uncharacterized protein C4orf17 homolog [Microcaecilia unicolor]XP_030046594.1 uncharacterized protein C4orf17 homolog [Microcaecilia unicolor]XP_030046595.1 uncharacterized protein C4orf17 homolog [Microcaecilia unicolor]